MPEKKERKTQPRNEELFDSPTERINTENATLN